MDKTTDKSVLARVSLLQENQSLRDFCVKVGWSYRAAQKSYQRRSSPDTESLVKIATYFQVDLKWLITGESNPLMSPAIKKLKWFRKRKKLSVEELVEKVGSKQGNPASLAKTLELFEKGLVAISIDFLYSIAEKMAVPFQEFLREEEPIIAHVPELKVFQSSSTQGAPQIRNEDYVSVPLTTSAIAAGQPLISENNIEDYVLLHIRAAGKRKNLVASRVDGVSMEPMLHSGDIVVIDRDDRKIVRDKMYAVFYEEGLTAKFVERQKDLLILRPINPKSQLQVVDLIEHPDPIVGRVIGAWKEF